jgi:hypothetical protein
MSLTEKLLPITTPYAHQKLDTVIDRETEGRQIRAREKRGEMGHRSRRSSRARSSGRYPTNGSTVACRRGDIKGDHC